MRSPRDMRIIEIDITNACDRTCSNCTRMCGHQKKSFFMDFETFKRAVDSLDGYQGIRSIMGGEPTLHPEFERFAAYLGSKFPKRENPYIYPQKEFIKQVHRVELDNFQIIHDHLDRIDVVGPGMFSNMGPGYKKNYEIISDVMPFQGLNDHTNKEYHQANLITRKELGIPDDEWVKLRDKCWLQNEWSASITPKGCFFCEIAGVLDMILDGPGGWPIEPGWWKKTPEEFGDQLHWCELCGFALNTFTRDPSEEIDDVSPVWYEKLKEMQTSKFKSGRVNQIKIKDGKIAEESMRENRFFSPEMPYLEHYEDRFNAMNSILFIHEYENVVIPEGKDFGKELNKVLKKAEDWIVLRSENAILADDFDEKIAQYVFNPGTMHFIDLSKCNDCKFVKNASSEKEGYVAFFSKRAISLRQFGFDRIAHCNSINDIISAWQQNKIVQFSSIIDEAGKRLDIQSDYRYIIWGAGDAGTTAYDEITKNGGTVVAVIDKDINKVGNTFKDQKIQSVDLLDDFKDFDVLIAANYTRFIEIKREAEEKGVEANKIQYINSLSI